MRRSILLSFLLAAAVFVQGIVAQGVGNAAPEFTLVDRSGEPVRLSDFQGTPLVLNTWATWCPPCREELLLFQEAHDTLNETEEAVAFLLLNAGEGAEKAEAYLDEVGVTLPAALDATREERAAFEGGLDETADVLRRYRARGMPTTFFIDTSGTIQFVRQGLLAPPTSRMVLPPLVWTDNREPCAGAPANHPSLAGFHRRLERRLHRARFQRGAGQRPALRA